MCAVVACLTTSPIEARGIQPHPCLIAFTLFVSLASFGFGCAQLRWVHNEDACSANETLLLQAATTSAVFLLLTSLWPISVPALTFFISHVLFALLFPWAACSSRRSARVLMLYAAASQRERWLIDRGPNALPLPELAQPGLGNSCVEFSAQIASPSSFLRGAAKSFFLCCWRLLSACFTSCSPTSALPVMSFASFRSKNWPFSARPTFWFCSPFCSPR